MDLIVKHVIRITLFAALSLPLAAQSPTINNGGSSTPPPERSPSRPGRWRRSSAPSRV
jgi:hypothetical protein